MKEKYPNANNSFFFPFSPINLFLDGKRYIPNHKLNEPSTIANFVFSIPNKKEFDVIKQKERHVVTMFDGFFELILNFDKKQDGIVEVEINLFTEHKMQYIIMNIQDLFIQFDQMWVDLVDVLKEVYPTELVDLEMEKIYTRIDERLLEGRV